MLMPLNDDLTIHVHQNKQFILPLRSRRSIMFVFATHILSKQDLFLAVSNKSPND